MNCSDVFHAGSICATALTAQISRDWSVTAPQMSISVSEVVAHSATGPLWYALDLWSGRGDDAAFEVGVRAGSTNSALVRRPGTRLMVWGWVFGRMRQLPPQCCGVCSLKSSSAPILGCRCSGRTDGSNQAGPAAERNGNGIRLHCDHTPQRCHSHPGETMKAPNHIGSEPSSSGGGKGTRTPNPLLAKQVRYQLRHTPRRDSPSHRVGVFGPFGLGTLITVPPPEENSESHKCETTENPFLHDPPRKDVGLPGLEPGTSSLSAKRSNRLSYRPFSGGEPEVKRYPTGHSNTNRLTVTRLTCPHHTHRTGSQTSAGDPEFLWRASEPPVRQRNR